MDAVFAVAPFSDVQRPAIGVSTLVSGVRQAGFSARVEYVHLQLAAWMGVELYQWIHQLGDQLLLDAAKPSISLVGEWFFAGVLFPGQLPPEEDYLAKFVAPDARGRARSEALADARRLYAAKFVEYAARAILRHRPRVVGFTTTFHQTLCSLAVAKALKEAADPPAVMLGGANCEGEMGRQLIRSFPWIDYVCTGEGDEAVPEFLQRFIREGNPEPPPGILRQGFAEVTSVPKRVARMDDLPIPDFHDYFEGLEACGLREVEPVLTIETARGCWWGAKHHCTFCGLNGDGMAYRSKSAERAAAEMIRLAETYGVERLHSVDNILDTRYIGALFPELARRNAGLDLFYEVKSNLRYDQLKTMREGGVGTVQPGIESFSNATLALMRKGCTGLQNIQMLRWCAELGIVTAWNLLYGFPEELPAEYERMAELVPRLTHLPPPAFCCRIRLDRFSPLYMRAGELGLGNVRAMKAYSYVFPLPESALRELAYFFEFDYRDGRNPAEYARPLIERVEEWIRLGESIPARLDAYGTGDLLVIEDTRPCATGRQHIFTGLAARVYRECDSAARPGTLAGRVGAEEAEIRRVVGRFLEERLMAEMDGQVLSLAVFRDRETAAMREADATHFGQVLVNLS